MRRRAMWRPGVLLLTACLLQPAGWRPAGAQQEPPPVPPPAAPAAGAPEEPLPLSLDEELRAALENNLDIIVRSYDPLRAEDLLVALEAVFDPAIFGAATSRDFQTSRASSFLSQDKSHEYSITFSDPLILGGRYDIQVGSSDAVTGFCRTDPLNPLGPCITSTAPEYNTSWQISYAQPLLRNFGAQVNRYLILIGRNDLGASEAQFRQAVLDTMSDAEKAYWDLNFALMDLATRRGSLQLAKDFLDQNRIKVRVGTLAPIEITQAEAGVADREEGVIIAENAVRSAEDRVRRVMNVPPDSPLWSRPILPSDPPPLVEVALDTEAIIGVALRSRPDLEQARLDLGSRRTELQFRRNQRRWDLGFQGTYGNAGFNPLGYPDAFDALRDDKDTSWTATLNLGVPIGNRQAKANYSEAGHALDQAQRDLERLEQAVRVEMRDTVRQVETNLKRVRAAQVNVRLQREKLDAEQKKFQNGMSTSFQVLQFQTDLATAESRLNQAIVDYNKSLVDLERGKGTLLESRRLILPGTGAGGTEGPRDSTTPEDSGDTGTEAPRQPATPGQPGTTPPGTTPGTLRSLWRKVSDSPRYALRPATLDGAPVTLPAEFVFDGRRVVAAAPGRTAGAGRVNPEIR